MALEAVLKVAQLVAQEMAVMMNQKKAQVGLIVVDEMLGFQSLQKVAQLNGFLEGQRMA